MRMRCRGRSNFFLSGSRFWLRAASISRLPGSSAAMSLRNRASFASVAMRSPAAACTHASSLCAPVLGFAERHAETAQQLTGLVIVARTGHEGDVHALHKVHLVR